MQQAQVHARLLNRQQVARGRPRVHRGPRQAHLRRLRPQPGLLHARHVAGGERRENEEPHDHLAERNHQSGTERRGGHERLREAAVRVDAARGGKGLRVRLRRHGVLFGAGRRDAGLRVQGEGRER